MRAEEKQGNEEEKKSLESAVSNLSTALHNSLNTHTKGKQVVSYSNAPYVFSVKHTL